MSRAIRAVRHRAARSPGAPRLLAAILLLLGASAGRAQEFRPEGTWIVSDRVAVEIFDCEGRLCGRIAWLRNPALRTPQMCGRTIVWGLTRTGERAWGNGAFFDPENGQTYDLSAELESFDTIAARIYEGIPLFGRTEILRRIAPRSLADWC